jgi:periplasmic protein TonB
VTAVIPVPALPVVSAQTRPAIVAPVVPQMSVGRQARALPVALGLSGLWHGAALALAVSAGIFQAGSGAAPVRVAEVSVMSQSAFDAMNSAAPVVAMSPPPAPPPASAVEAADAPEGAVDAWQPSGVSVAPDAPMRDAAMPVPSVPPVAAKTAPEALRAVEAKPNREPEVAEPAQLKRDKKIKQAAATPAPDAPSGGGRAAGRTTGTAAGSTGAEKSLMADWGASLRGKLDRARRYPSGAGGATGKVMLRLTVAVSGQVLAVKVRASSGHAALDRAALDAVKRAGRLPKAPKGLARDSYSFNLPVLFTQ